MILLTVFFSTTYACLAKCSTEFFSAMGVAGNWVGGEFSSIAGSDSALNGRRLLAEYSVPPQCFNMDDSVCDGVVAEGMPTFDVFDTTNAFGLVSFFCCALRDDNAIDLYQVAREFQALCLGEKYLTWQSNLSSTKGLPFSQWAIAHYCPNYISPDDFVTNTWADLWSIASFQLPKTAVLQCDGGAPTATGTVDIMVHGLSEDLFPHVHILVEGEVVGWTPEQPRVDSTDYNSLLGLPGLFHVVDVADFKMPPDALVWTVQNVDIARLQSKRREFENQGTYDLISNNCAHVALQLLAEGLGCRARTIPFFSPVAMVGVLKGMCEGKYW